MSSTRQLGTSGSLLRSNSDPEPKSADCRPTDRNRLASALRIETSSSTTKTMGVDCGSSFFIARRATGARQDHGVNRSVKQVKRSREARKHQRRKEQSGTLQLRMPAANQLWGTRRAREGGQDRYVQTERKFASPEGNPQGISSDRPRPRRRFRYPQSCAQLANAARSCARASDSLAGLAGNCKTVASWPSHRNVRRRVCPSGNSSAS